MSQGIIHAFAPSCLPLYNNQDFIDTSHPTLGALFFPFIPLNRKWATHKQNQKTLAPNSPCKAELLLSFSSWVSQLSQVKTSQGNFRSISLPINRVIPLSTIPLAL